MCYVIEQRATLFQILLTGITLQNTRCLIVQLTYQNGCIRLFGRIGAAKEKHTLVVLLFFLPPLKGGGHSTSHMDDTHM